MGGLQKKAVEALIIYLSLYAGGKYGVKCI
jgi:hypothetical protein